MLFGLVLFPSRFVSARNESGYTVSGLGLGTLPPIAIWGYAVGPGLPILGP